MTLDESLRKATQKSVDSASEMLQSVLLPICKMLIKCSLGAGALFDAAKVAYLQAALNEVIPLGRRVNISRISVVTGLTRKEISALLQRRCNRSIGVSRKKSLQQRALRVLHGWSVDHSFRQPSGKPADLALRGEHHSFPSLVKRYGGDVTPVSVLRELERMNAVRVASGKVKYRRRAIKSGTRAAHELAEFARAFKDFANTIQQLSKPREPPLFFGFKDSTVTSPHQAALFQRTFSKRATVLLESIDQWVAHQAKAEKRKRQMSKSKTRVGLGVYLIQDDK